MDFFGTGFDLVVALDEPGVAWYQVTLNGGVPHIESYGNPC
jgi:hypothetical protein